MIPLIDELAAEELREIEAEARAALKKWPVKKGSTPSTYLVRTAMSLVRHCAANALPLPPGGVDLLSRAVNERPSPERAAREYEREQMALTFIASHPEGAALKADAVKKATRLKKKNGKLDSGIGWYKAKVLIERANNPADYFHYRVHWKRMALRPTDPADYAWAQRADDGRPGLNFNVPEWDEQRRAAVREALGE